MAELFSIPGRLVHLRRWAFQDVLLVPKGSVPAQAPAMSVSFACLDRLQQFSVGRDRMIAAHERGLLLTVEQQAAILGPEWNPDRV